MLAMHRLHLNIIGKYMFYELISFPLWKNDEKAIIKLSSVQKKYIQIFNEKVKRKEYGFIENNCLCGNKDKDKDLLISEKDRYGIACNIVLCEKCGLIRLEKRLDDESTAHFYMNLYRYIYVGIEFATQDFFTSQMDRGRTFLNLLKKYARLNDIDNVFEVGCGAGGLLYPFYLEDKFVSGCDFGEKYLEFGIYKGLNLYQGEIDPVKTPKESQDLIILSHVMEHLNNPLEALIDIIEYIKPGKYLLVEVPGIFDIKNTYHDPILYFQNAHVYNYYYSYLKRFFEALGLKVLYGNERCTFILQKPREYAPNKHVLISSDGLSLWADKVAKELKKQYLVHHLKLNSYYVRIGLIKLLEWLGIKSYIKAILPKK